MTEADTYVAFVKDRLGMGKVHYAGPERQKALYALAKSAGEVEETNSASEMAIIRSRIQHWKTTENSIVKVGVERLNFRDETLVDIDGNEKKLDVSHLSGMNWKAGMHWKDGES